MARFQQARGFLSRHWAQFKKRQKEEQRDWRREYRHMRQWITLFGSIIAVVIVVVGWFVTESRKSDIEEREQFESTAAHQRELFESQLRQDLRDTADHERLSREQLQLLLSGTDKRCSRSRHV